MHTISETGRLLHDDHHRVLDLITRLEAFLGQWEERAPPLCDGSEERVLVTDFQRLLVEEVEHHFDFEEQTVFPILETAGAYGLTGMLAEQHIQMRPLARRLRHFCVLALRDGFDEETWPVFHAFSADLAERLVSHIQAEEIALLEAVDAALSPDIDRLLAEAYRKPAM